MDLISQYLYDNTLSKEKILELVDEYTLYCYYISEAYGVDTEIELRKAMRSPIKLKDDTPSFSVFESNNKYYEYLWKDSAIPESGAIFKLIRRIYDLKSDEEVLKIIDRDFELGIGGEEVKTNKIILKDKPLVKEKMSIRIRSKRLTKEAIDFLLQFTTSNVIASTPNLRLVECVWYTDTQKYPVFPKYMTFAYIEYDYLEKRNRHQLYSPYAPKVDKFRNDFSDGVIPGYSRLTFTTDTLIITKASKDILTWNSFGFEAICGRAETTILPLRVIEYLKTKYKRIVVWLDNDPAGCYASHIYRGMGLEVRTIYKCLLFKSKDLSDMYKDYGRIETRKLIDLLI
jgi:hypothetical protein